MYYLSAVFREGVEKLKRFTEQNNKTKQNPAFIEQRWTPLIVTIVCELAIEYVKWLQVHVDRAHLLCIIVMYSQ